MVGSQNDSGRCLLFAIGITEVDILPVAHQFTFRDSSLGYSTVTFGHDDRPTSAGPSDTAHLSHHNSVAISIAAYIGGESSLRGIKPVAIAVIENSTVGNAHPTITGTELIRMGDYRIGITTCIRHILTINAYIRSIDVLTADDTGVISH